MKKCISLLLILVMLFPLVSCGEIEMNIVSGNLINAGYTVTSHKADDMIILQDTSPKKVLSATNVLDSITVFLYNSEKDAQKAMEIYKNTMEKMISVLKIGVKENAFYIATTDTVIEIAFNNA